MFNALQSVTMRCAKPAPLRVMFRSCYVFLFSGQKNRGSMDRVHGVVHGPGSMFCIRPSDSVDVDVDRQSVWSCQFRCQISGYPATNCIRTY